MITILCTIFLFFLSQCDGQLPKKKKYHHNKKELKYAECSVCEEAMKVLSRNITALRKQKKHWEVVSEEVFLDHMEDMCNPKVEQGEWIMRLDLVPYKKRLVVKEQDNYGKCKTECHTISEVCSRIIEKHDIAISELLWKGAKRSVLTNQVCNKLSKSCTKKRLKKLKKSKVLLGQEQFEPMSDSEWKAHKLMRGMKNMPNVNMFSRNDLKGMAGKQNEEKDKDIPSDSIISKFLDSYLRIARKIVKAWRDFWTNIFNYVYSFVSSPKTEL